VLDGVDVFILSHETSIGNYALEATVLQAKSIAEAENVFDHELAF
jgi:pyruvate kinase